MRQTTTAQAGNDKQEHLLQMEEKQDLLVATPAATRLKHPRHDDPVPKCFATCYIVWFSLTLCPSVAALLFAATSSSPSSLCYSTPHFIALASWLYIGSIPSLVVAIAYICIYSYQLCCASLSAYTACSLVLSSSQHSYLQCVLGILYFIWGVGGFIVYGQSQCHSTDMEVVWLLLCVFQLLSTCFVFGCATLSKGFSVAKLARRLKYRSHKNSEFRLSQQEIEFDACPELLDASWKAGHDYVSVLPFATPSLAYREFDHFLHANKLKNAEQLRQRIAAEKLTPKSIMRETRAVAQVFSMTMVKMPSTAEHVIVDNIYLNNDVRFAVVAHREASVDTGIIQYTHGGAYVIGSHRDAFPMLALLSELTGCVAISIDYKLAPEFPLPQCVDDALTVYRWLCDADGVRTRASGAQQHMRVSPNCPQWLRQMAGADAHKKIVIAGDSAGGGLALLTVLAIKNSASLRMPCCAWPISPWTRLKGFGDRNSLRDAMLTDVTELQDILLDLVLGNMDVETGALKHETDAGFCDADDAKYSPVNAELGGLCPLYLSVSAAERLLDDTLKFAEKAHGQGVEIQVEIEPFMCHVYPTFVSIFPEAKTAVARAAKFIKRHLNAAAA